METATIKGIMDMRLEGKVKKFEEIMGYSLLGK
ncbi:MAG: hypothetical protein BWY64_03786 [bacterium ADurb.Bin363]|nr:MAG: hypothetical protein BWY64_03786 [bacterium ADurb.Bin363]